MPNRARADATGNGHDGTFHGDAATTPGGRFGRAFTFDGSGDYLQIGDTLDLGDSDFTLSVWLQGDPAMDPWGRILDKGFASGYALGRRAGTEAIGFEFLASGSQGNNFATDSALVDGDWHHVALVKAGNTVSLYADGTLENSQTVSGAAQDNALPLLIGYNPGQGALGFWKGQLDELKIFGRALLSAEIAALANPLLGDYNNNGVVDAADYTVWRDNLGAPAGTLPNDADGGVIGPAQYATWKANFGSAAGGGAAAHSAPGDSAGANYAVPEPGAWLLALGGTLGMVLLTLRKTTT